MPGKCGRDNKERAAATVVKDGGQELISIAIKRMYQSNNVEDEIKKNVWRSDEMHEDGRPGEHPDVAR